MTFSLEKRQTATTSQGCEQEVAREEDVNLLKMLKHILTKSYLR
jgi:hypothetical protein